MPHRQRALVISTLKTEETDSILNRQIHLKGSGSICHVTIKSRVTSVQRGQISGLILFAWPSHNLAAPNDAISGRHQEAAENEMSQRKDSFTEAILLLFSTIHDLLHVQRELHLTIYSSQRKGRIESKSNRTPVLWDIQFSGEPYGQRGRPESSFLSHNFHRSSVRSVITCLRHRGFEWRLWKSWKCHTLLGPAVNTAHYEPCSEVTECQKEKKSYWNNSCLKAAH